MIVTTYQWPKFKLEYEPGTGRATTFYPNERWSGCNPVPDDKYHGDILGITPGMHRLGHEICHHLIGLYFYKDLNGSPIVYRDAHHIPQTEDANLEEWYVNALHYFIYDKKVDLGALMDLEKAGINIRELRDYGKWLLGATKFPQVLQITC